MRPFVGLIVVFILAACANVVPPTGGPPDLKGPQLRGFSIDSSSNKKSYRFNVQFDENIELKQSSNIFFFPGGFKPSKAVAHQQSLQLEFDSSLFFPGIIDWSDAVRDVNNQNPSSIETLAIDPQNKLSKDSISISFSTFLDPVDAFPLWIEITDSLGHLLRKKKIEKKESVLFRNISYQGASAKIARKEFGDTLSKFVSVSGPSFEIQVGYPFGDEKIFGVDSLLDAKINVVSSEKMNGKLYEFREGKWFTCRSMENKQFRAVSGKTTFGYFTSNQSFLIFPLEIKKQDNTLKIDEFFSPSSIKR
jgi:hypothetical protein